MDTEGSVEGGNRKIIQLMLHNQGQSQTLFLVFLPLLSVSCVFLIYLYTCGNSTCNRNNIRDSSLFVAHYTGKGREWDDQRWVTDMMLWWKKPLRNLTHPNAVPWSKESDSHQTTLIRNHFCPFPPPLLIPLHCILDLRKFELWPFAACGEKLLDVLCPFFCTASTIRRRWRWARCLCSKAFVLSLSLSLSLSPSLSLSSSLSIVCAIWQEWMLVTSHFLQNTQGCALF